MADLPMDWHREDNWCVVRDIKGFHRALHVSNVQGEGIQRYLNGRMGPDTVIGSPMSYLQACKHAEDLNTVSEIMEEPSEP